MRGTPLRLGILLSGGGRTLENLFEQIDEGKLPAQVVTVIANKKSAFGLERARKRDVPTEVVLRKHYESAEAFAEAIAAPLRQTEVDLVVMAGFLALWLVPKDFRHRVMNIHPALLPAFGGRGYYGEHVHRAVFESGVKVSGCTVHFADNEYDQGPIICQKTVAITADDDPDRIAAKVFELECQAYPEAIRLYAADRLKIEGRRVRIR